MTTFQSIDEEANRKNLRLLLNLRGLAFAAQLTAVFLTYHWLNIVLPVWTMVGVAALLVVFNLYSFYRLRLPQPVTTWDLFAGLVLDVTVLTVQLHLSGGTSNPLVSVYILPVIIGAAMLDARKAWSIYGLTIVGYLALAILAAPAPEVQVVHSSHAHGGALIDRSDLHMNGMMLGYFLCAGCLVAVVTRIRTNLARRDSELEHLKTRSLEQEHIMRLGLLTAGAAHELGTPLTTLSILLKDWRDLSPPRRKAERDAELATMSAQVDRCKAIISDILTASGQSRGEGASAVALTDFLRQVTDDWLRTHSAELTVSFPADNHRIVGDKVLELALFNLLDNAYEASAAAGSDKVGLVVTLADKILTIDVTDAGEGFAPETLASLGQPFNSTKASTGRGLGLFLVRNAAQALDGSLEAQSRRTGSRVRLSFPLSALEIERHD